MVIRSKYIRIKILLLFFFYLILFPINSVFAGSDKSFWDGFSILIVRKAVGYTPSNSSFKDIYSNEINIKTLNPEYIIGLGSSGNFFIGKYREFNTMGKSKLKNFDIEGTATWKQKFNFLGGRFYSNQAFSYIDLGAVITQVEETIGTKNPEIPQLSRTAKIEKVGAGIGLGLNIPIFSFLSISGDLDYSYIPGKGQGKLSDKTIDIGGLSYGFGINLFFGN